MEVRMGSFSSISKSLNALDENCLSVCFLPSLREKYQVGSFDTIEEVESTTLLNSLFEK